MALMRVGKIRVEQIKGTSDSYADLGEQLRAMPDAWEYVVHPTTDGQVVFTLPRTYTMGYTAMTIYLNGQKIQGGTEPDAMYTEVDPNTIRFHDEIGLLTSDTLVFRQEGVGAATSFVAEVEHIVREKPIGVYNGVNKTFQLAKYPRINSECVFFNGVLLEPGPDYTISNKIVTLATAPQATDRVVVNYLVNRNAVITYTNDQSL